MIGRTSTLLYCAAGDVTRPEGARARLAESRRMCLASLDMSPDRPNLDLTLVRIPRLGPLNAIALYVLGLFHADSHLEQLREIMRQMAGKD